MMIESKDSYYLYTKPLLQVYTPNVDENAGQNTLVTTVVASDKDGDGVKFGFVGGTTTSGLFRIEENTGVIRLVSNNIQLDRDKYELNVTAMDDGKCCLESSKGAPPPGPGTLHTSTAVVVVFITDVNDNKPVFQVRNDTDSRAKKAFGLNKFEGRAYNSVVLIKLLKCVNKFGCKP